MCLLSHAVEDRASPWMARRISAGKLRSFRRPTQLAWVKAKNVLPLRLKISHINLFHHCPVLFHEIKERLKRKILGLRAEMGSQEIPSVGAGWLRSSCFSVTSFKDLLFLVLQI